MVFARSPRGDHGGSELLECGSLVGAFSPRSRVTLQHDQRGGARGIGTATDIAKMLQVRATVYRYFSDDGTRVGVV